MLQNGSYPSLNHLLNTSTYMYLVIILNDSFAESFICIPETYRVIVAGRSEDDLILVVASLSVRGTVWWRMVLQRTWRVELLLL